MLTNKKNGRIWCLEEVLHVFSKFSMPQRALPMMDENDKTFLSEFVESKDLNYLPEVFTNLYNEDELGGMIRNLDFWLRENFLKLVSKK